MELKICWYCQGYGSGSHYDVYDREVIDVCVECLGKGYVKAVVSPKHKADNKAALKKAIEALDRWSEKHTVY